MIVADASSLIKLVLHEPESAYAFSRFEDFIDEGEIISSPEIAFVESLNAIWKHYVLLRNIDKNEFEYAINMLSAVWDKIDRVSSEPLSIYAIKIAVENKISIYDSLYLAQCKLNNGKLFTFDTKLIEKAKLLGIDIVKRLQ